MHLMSTSRPRSGPVVLENSPFEHLNILENLTETIISKNVSHGDFAVALAYL